MTVFALLSLLVACGLEDIKYGDSGNPETVDPDTLDEGGESDGDEDSDDGGGPSDVGGGTDDGGGSSGSTTGGTAGGESDEGGTSGSTTAGTTDDGTGTGGTTADGGSTGDGATTGGSSGGGPCSDIEVEDCSGVCVSGTEAFRIGDGVCDDSYPNLNCYTWAYDGGDCDELSDGTDPGGTTGSGTGDDGGGTDYPAIPGGPCERYDGSIGIYDCSAEECRPDWWLGDEVCDSIYDLDCEATGWDGGDCDPAASDDECFDVTFYDGYSYFIDPSADPYTNDFASSCGAGYGSSDVAYLWSPAFTREYCITARVASTSEGTDIAPVVSVWNTDCETEVECAAGDWIEDAASATISGYYSEGSSYLVVLEHYWSVDDGYFELTIEPCPIFTK